MTRYARGGEANKKKANEATSWAEMKSDMAAAAATRKASSKAPRAGGGGKVITRLQNGQFAVRIGGYEKILRTEADLRRWKRTGSERRRVQRKQRREETRVCFLCRQPGHLVGECPEATAATGSGSGGGSGSVCFRCGSSEHALAACPKMPRAGSGGDSQQSSPPDLPFASCFVCGRSGHLSRACPDNPRGLYPKGGGCLLCSSVEHLKRDCPLMQKRRAADAEAHAVALPTRVATAAGVDDEVPLLPTREAADDDACDAAAADGSSGAAAKKRRTKKVKVVVL